MINIPRHKVFISYYHKDDQWYKDKLLTLNEIYNLFDDYSVHEDEIDDTGMTDEGIRREIRDNYIKKATVLILLCGKNTRTRKHIDWEIHAAMYHSDANPQMGILVINVDGDNGQIACGKEEENVIAPYVTWTPLQKNIASLKKSYPDLPDRIIENIAREEVSITVVNWNNIANDVEKIKYLIDRAYERRYSNKYDHSTPLRGRNS